MRVKNSILLAFTLFLLNGCVSAPNMERINVSPNVSSKILNLKNSGNGNTSNAMADRVMKGGFLSTGEEYGYYTLDMTSKEVGGGLSPGYFLGLFTLFIGFFLGAPFDYSDYELTVTLVILNSKMNVIRTYSDSTKIRQSGGMYYGDATGKANDGFTRLVRNVQQKAASDSATINTELRSAGPIGGEGGLVGAVDKATKVIVGFLQERNLKNQKIAIVNVSSTDRDQSIFVAGELENILFQNKFTIVDRSELDKIRREQNFQLSGEVADDQVVSIGKISGAGLVITGSITGSGSMRRLRLRVLDVQTAELRGSASEAF